MVSCLKLSNTLPPPTSCRYGKTCADKGETDSPRLTDAYVSKSLVADKLKALKTRKSTGPDNIPPKLLKLAGDAIVPSLLSLYRLILESVVNDIIVRHVYKANNLVTDKQWAYRAGFLTELILTQLTKTWKSCRRRLSGSN